MLKDGIIDRDLGCPSVTGQRGGYVVLERYLQPPHYGVIGYLLADFNQDEPALTDLGTSDGAVPESHNPKDHGLYLDDGGLVLRYTGILPDALAPENQPDDPPPADRAVLYSFSLGTLQNLDTCMPLKDVPLCGDANGAVMPLFQFEHDRLKAVRFEALEF